MAQRVSVALEDDLDGGPAAETVRFSFDGGEYEIDLNTKNAAAFRKQLSPFIERARAAGRGQRGRSPRTAASRQRSGDIRAWAKDHGIEVSERGRIPAGVVQQYHTATQGRLHSHHGPNGGLKRRFRSRCCAPELTLGRLGWLSARDTDTSGVRGFGGIPPTAGGQNG